MNVYLGAASAICPLGNNLETIYEQMVEGRSGISEVKTPYGLEKDEYLGIIPEELLISEEGSKLRRMLCTTLDQSIADLKDSSLVSAADTRVILCTTKGEVDRLEEGDVEGAQLYNLAEFLQNKYSLAHRPAIVSSACISGLLGVINGVRLIRSGVARNVIVIGADLVTPFTLSGFISFYATATSPSRPYDKSRDGINLGEAAASVVLSSEETTFNTTMGKYLGGASANDANHISGPSRTGEGLFRSIDRAMSEAGLAPDELDFISAHGTATAFNDEMESIAFDRMGMNSIPMNSMKAYFGHTLGAAGLLESLIGLQSLKSGKLLRSLGYKESGVSRKINVLHENRKGSFRRMMKTSSGFGGSNAAAIFELP